MKRDIVQVSLNIEVPEEKWLAKVNTQFPELIFNIMSKFLIDEHTGLTLFQIKGRSIEQFLLDFKALLKPEAYQILHKGPEILIVNVKISDPWILNALVKTQLLVTYPISVKEGMLKINAITERSKVDFFLEELDKKKIDYVLERIGYYHQAAILTPRQKEILQKVYTAGYFEIPRARSLSELAEELKISSSALSELLRRISKRLAENYFESLI